MQTKNHGKHQIIIQIIKWWIEISEERMLKRMNQLNNHKLIEDNKEINYANMNYYRMLEDNEISKISNNIMAKRLEENILLEEDNDDLKEMQRR